MNRDRFEGGVRHVRGRAKTALGAIAGRAGPQVEGAIDQIAGGAQHAYGRTREAAEGLQDEVRREGGRFVRDARRRGEALADDLGERGRHYRTEALRHGRSVAHRADENKTATLLLVAAAAFSFGWLLRRAD